MGSCQELSLNDPRFAELDLAIARYRDRRDGIVYVLERARYLFGILPDTVLLRIAHTMAISPGDLYQAISFDNQFANRPVGTHTVSICLGTRCYLAGAGLLFDRLKAELGIGPGETTPDGLFTLTVCHADDHSGDEPGFFIDEQHYVVPPEKIPTALDAFRHVEVLVGTASRGQSKPPPDRHNGGLFSYSPKLNTLSIMRRCSLPTACFPILRRAGGMLLGHRSHRR